MKNIETRTQDKDVITFTKMSFGWDGHFKHIHAFGASFEECVVNLDYLIDTYYKTQCDKEPPTPAR